MPARPPPRAGCWPHTRLDGRSHPAEQAHGQREHHGPEDAEDWWGHGYFRRGCRTAVACAKDIDMTVLPGLIISTVSGLLEMMKA